MYNPKINKIKSFKKRKWNENLKKGKSSNNITSKHLSGLKAFKEEYEVKKTIVIFTEPLPRIMDGI